MLVGGGAGLGQLGVYVGECFSGCHNLCGAYLCGCRNNLGIGPLYHCKCHQVQKLVLSQQVCSDRPGSLGTGLQRALDISSRIGPS